MKKMREKNKSAATTYQNQFAVRIIGEKGQSNKKNNEQNCSNELTK